MKLIDSTMLGFVFEHREKYLTKNEFELIGLDVHKTSSPHPQALHVLEKPMQKRLTGRQNDLNHFARKNNYKFQADINWNIEKLKFHLNEYHRNRIVGKFNSKYNWEISDLTYSDGILMAREEHHFTVMIIQFPQEIGKFTFTKKSVKQIRNKTKFELLDDNKFENLNNFLLQNDSYYLESMDEEMLLYKKERWLAAKEIIAMHDFGQKLCSLIPDIKIQNSRDSYGA